MDQRHYLMATVFEHWSPEHEQFGWVDGNGRWRPTSEAAPWWPPDADEHDGPSTARRRTGEGHE